ncbi:alpha/beta hydrolase [Streptomyces sp. NPDC047999]|uniref:alpha/beta hydrolase n=1 Tax=Streptomyces sp. NPDC047999 TaxID=3365497 RepID=UPI00371AF626
MRAIQLPDGARLSTYVDGPAQAPVTAVLVHGLSVTAALWRSHVPLLLHEGIRVVRYDHRAHGNSTRGTAALNLDQLADDLAQVLDSTAPQGPLVLAGHSMGAMTVMLLVARHPRLAPRIRGLLGAVTAAEAHAYADGLSAHVSLGIPTPADIPARARRRPAAAVPPSKPPAQRRLL